MLSQYFVLLIVCSSMLWSSSLWATVKEYHLTIAENTVNLTGKAVTKVTVNGQFPAPTLTFEEGDEAVIHVDNQLQQDSSIHWHGLLLPGLMDGVPGFNQYQGIKPNGHFEYRFKIRQHGTYWYHAHSKGQEQDGLYGAFIVYPKGKQPLATYEKTQQDHVVMLSDFHESSSQTLLNNLKKSAEYYQNQRETLGDVWQQIKTQGLISTWQDRKMWNQMRMLKTDLSDVTGYTFLINGQPPTQHWIGQFDPQDKIRLRFINASAMSFFDVRIPNLKMTVVSADGQPVQPVDVDEFRIGAAETYDVLVEPSASSYQIQAESIDRTGFALGYLQQRHSTQPQYVMPTARPRSLLNMADMGHGDDQQQAYPETQMSQDHSIHQHAMLPLPQHAENKRTEGWANASTSQGHKALAYSDLKSMQPQTNTHQPERELVIRLGGTMERYSWTINGKKFNEAEPLNVRFGERIRLKFINNSMMAHPMHLHGMFMQLENGQQLKDLPNKHTIVVPPNQTVSALLTADELGEWALHCHLLYHMSAGMMTKLIVANVNSQPSLSLPMVDVNHEENPHAHH